MNITGNKIPPKIIELDIQQFPNPWTLKDWQELDLARHLLYAWESEQEIVGFALFSRLPGDDTSHLLKICLQSDHRRKGEAQKFWSKILTDLKSKEVRSIYLEVEETNWPARGFYSKNGFQTLRTIKNFYSDGSTAITMLLTL